MSLKKILLLLVVSLFFLSIANASPILCQGNVTNAQQLQALGVNGCQFGSVIFFNFTYTYTFTAGVSPDEPGSAVALAFSFDGANPLRPVITFTGTGNGWDAQNDDVTDIGLHYSACIIGPSCGPGVAPSPALNIVATNASAQGNFGFEAGDSLGTLLSYSEKVSPDTTGDPLIPINLTIAPSQPTTWGFMSTNSGGDIGVGNNLQVSFTKDIEMFAGDRLVPGTAPGADDAQMTQFTEGLVLAPVPEPASYLTIAGALAALSLVMRKRRA